MGEWLSGLVGGIAFSALVWIFLALACLVFALVVLRILRGGRAGKFVVGEHHRIPRLNVIDVAAVDDQRRLVLIRRDDVEHLILIGGPTDVVVEQTITARKEPAPAQPARSTEERQYRPRREPELASVSAAETRAQPALQADPFDVALEEELLAAEPESADSWADEGTPPEAPEEDDQHAYADIDVAERRPEQRPQQGQQRARQSPPPPPQNRPRAQHRPARGPDSNSGRQSPDVSIEEEMSRLLEDLRKE